jgi:tRNA A-37 threonylcarbamoyl transferase component Bud32/tetratricopeptide (TPR) repeat protein
VLVEGAITVALHSNPDGRLRAALADRYAVEREIGRGGMATVYLARDLKHDRQVAIKVLAPELTESLGPERFLREIRTVAGLAHPNILPLFDSGEAGGFLFFVMPYVKGESLRDRLAKEGQLPVEDAVRITREIADALAYAHQEGVVHRDVKPGNIMLEAGHAVLTDFGVARAVAEARDVRLTGTGVYVGTPVYMSPEQAAGGGLLDGRSDQYALACVLYEMLAGHPPFTAVRPEALVHQHLTEKPPPVTRERPSVAEEIAQVIDRSLAKNPLDRFATTKAMADALASGEVPGAPRGHWGGSRAVTFAATLALALAVAAVISGVWPPRGVDYSAGRVVVLPFENGTGDPRWDSMDLGEVAAQRITRGLEGAPELRVVGFQELMSALETLEGAVPDQAFATSLGARFLVTGMYALAGDELVWEAGITDLVKEESLRALEVRGPADRARVLGGVDALRDALKGALAVSVDELGAYWGSSATSYAAAQALVRAEHSFILGRLQDAVAEYHEAYAQDSTLLYALMGAVSAYQHLGQWAKADSLISVVMSRRDELSGRELYWLAWMDTNQRGDLEGRLAAGELQLALDPSDDVTRATVVQSAVAAGQVERAVRLIEGLDVRNPVVRSMELQLRAPAGAYHLLGRYGDELRVAREVREPQPDEPGLRADEVRALIGLGRMDEVRQHLVAMEERGGYGTAWALLSTGLELARHGYGDEAREVAGRTVRWLSDAGPPPILLAEALLLAGRVEDALATAQDVVERQPDLLHARGLLGVTLALTGDRAGAEAAARWFEALDRPFLRGSDTFWRAAIAAHLDRKEEAVALLRQARREGRSSSGFHADQRLAPLWGFEPFEDLLRPTG